MTKTGYIDYFPGELLRKVAHRSVSTSMMVLPLKRCRAVARKSIPPRKLSLKKKPTARWSSNYCVTLSVSEEEDCNNQSYDSDSGSSSMSCCSSEASNFPTWSDEGCNNQNQSSADSECSSSVSCSSYYSTGASNHPSTQPIVYVLCKLVDGVLVRV